MYRIKGCPVPIYQDEGAFVSITKKEFGVLAQCGRRPNENTVILSDLE